MSEPFVGQIEIFAFNFAPRNWVLCAGQTMAISQNQALFALLGTIYGGNGVSTFNLPDLRSRVPVGMGTDFSGTQWPQGMITGEESHLVRLPEIPPHAHTLMASANKTTTTNTNTPAANTALCVTTGADQSGKPLTVPLYVADKSPSAVLDSSSVGTVGNMPHENRMPSLAINFCICLFGIFPSRG